MKGFRDEQGLISEESELSVSIPNQMDPDIAVAVEDIA